MIVREMKLEDLERIREIHELFFPDLEFPDFMHNFYCAFTITDDNNDIILGGGVRPMGEIVLVTDRDKSSVQIGRALIEARNASLFVGGKVGFNELVAFVQNNDSYARHLVRHGFYPRNSALAIQVPKWAEAQHVTTN